MGWMGGVLLLCGMLSAVAAAPTNSLSWNRQRMELTAEIHEAPLPVFLSKFARVTGWQVFMDPTASLPISAKFKQQPVGEAMRRMFGNLSFALTPPAQKDEPYKLYVFKNSVRDATQKVAPEVEKIAKPIPDELVVKLKPGTDADALAKSLGAKIIGRMDGQNAYRLKFDSESAANAGRSSLSANAAVTSVDSNYYMDRPRAADPFTAGSAPDIQLTAKPLGTGSGVVVGLIDTTVQRTKVPTDAFLLPSISVAGDANPNSAEPTHGTGMENAILQGMNAVYKSGASGVRILPVDVYGENINTTTFEVALGIERAINSGANVINLSLAGNGDNQLLHSVIQQATGKGILVVAAAGNDGNPTPSYPAAYPEVLAITAGDKNGNIAPFANYGGNVSLVAPPSIIVNYGGQSFVMTGTSTSSAFVSGVAAALADQSKKNSDAIRAMLNQLLPSAKK